MDPKNAPVTLAHVAGSEGAGDLGHDEFAHIDRLEGVEYEAALSKLSKDDRERFLAQS